MDYSFETIKKLISEFEFSEEFDMVVAVANGGIIPAAIINQRLCKEFNTITISLRDSSQKPIFDEPQLVSKITFNPVGKSILLVEDRVKTGASLQKAKKILIDMGAKNVSTFATNGKADYSLLDVPCFKFPWLI